MTHLLVPLSAESTPKWAIMIGAYANTNNILSAPTIGRKMKSDTGIGTSNGTYANASRFRRRN
jgi:hypothetical protein